MQHIIDLDEEGKRTEFKWKNESILGHVGIKRIS